MPESMLAALAAVPPELGAYAIGVVFLGYLVLGVSGFGSALTIVPLLALKWPLVSVVPLVLLLDLPSSLFLARLNLRSIEWRELRPLLAGMLPGAAIGVWLAQWSSQRWAPALLGLFVIGVALSRLSGRRSRVAAKPAWAPVAGALAGLVEALFGTSGPIVVGWIATRVDDARTLRATVPLALVGATLFALLGMGLAGQLDQPIVWASVPVLLVAALVGTSAGHRIAGKLRSRQLSAVISCLLLLAGALILGRSLR